MSQSNPAKPDDGAPSSSEEKGRGNSGEGKDPIGGLYPQTSEKPADSGDPAKQPPSAPREPGAELGGAARETAEDWRVAA